MRTWVLLLLSVPLARYGLAQGANCPTGGTTIVFSNGVLTTKQHARAALEEVQSTVEATLNTTQPTRDVSCTQYALAYDSEFLNSDSTTATVVNVVGQFATAAVQSGLTDYATVWSSLFQYSSVVPSLPDAWAQALGQDFSNVLIGVVAPVQQDLQTQTAMYQAQLNAGNNVMVVAHSQGNLYANEAYVLLSIPQGRQFNVVAVATPGDHVAGGGPWVTLQNDIILLVPHALSANTVNNNNPDRCDSAVNLASRTRCHDFTESYLTGDVSEPKIINDVIGPVGAFFLMSSGTQSATAGQTLTIGLPLGAVSVSITVTSASGGDLSVDGVPSLSLQPQGSTTLQVGVGTHIVTLTLNGVQVAGTVSVVPPASGTVSVQATLDGTPWPASGTASVMYAIACASQTITGTALPNIAGSISPGQCVANFNSGGPPNSSFGAFSPSTSQTLNSGEGIGFTLQFNSNPPTAGFAMSSGAQSATNGQTLNLIDAAGATVSVSFDATQRTVAYNTNTIMSWQWTIDGSIVATSAAFSQSLAIGTHTVSLVVADGRGAQSTPATATVVVTTTLSTATWVQQFPATSPPARNGFMMAYDAAHSQTVVFGGIGASGTLADTWVWDGTSWTQNFPAVSPPATHDGQMVYDEAREQTILVGGYTDPAGPTATWIWDGNTWTQSIHHAKPRIGVCRGRV
jgi:hypothetical protein